MTKRARRKLQAKLKKVFRASVQARKKHARLVSSYHKLQRKYRAA